MLFAVRLPTRHRLALRARSRSERIGLSEALRRCLDEWLAWGKSRPLPARPLTPDERKTFEQVFAAVGLKVTGKQRKQARR